VKGIIAQVYLPYYDVGQVGWRWLQPAVRAKNAPIGDRGAGCHGEWWI